jgi:putative transposase
MNRAIKYRIYPTEEQQVYFAKTFGCCRKSWNLMLEDWTKSYQETGKTIYTTPAKYKEEYPYLKEADSLALAMVQQNLKTAFKRFFEKKSGYPNFKSAKKSKKSYTTYNNHPTTIVITENSIKLPKVGFVKAKIHRLPKKDWVIKSATISQEADGKYYVSVLFEIEENVKTIEFKKVDNKYNAVGLDYKSDGLYMDSEKNVCGSPKFFRKSQKKLAKAQRKLKNKTKGSNNYKKQCKKIAAIHRHIANQRKDFLHKKSTEIANQYDIVCVETLNMQAISNKHMHLGKSTMDNGYGMFVEMLDYKLASRGKLLIKVDKWYASSQICHKCGNKKPMPLGVTTYVCDKCGHIEDRDYNAALNIRDEGLRLYELTNVSN